ncbi:hypothetical protein Tco_0378536, partial [Tanacetum coccineum]
VVFKLTIAGAPLPLSAATITTGPLAKEIKAIQDAIDAKTIPPKTDREILDEVLKSTDRAHIAGVGRQLAVRAIRIMGDHNQTNVIVPRRN